MPFLTLDTSGNYINIQISLRRDVYLYQHNPKPGAVVYFPSSRTKLSASLASEALPVATLPPMDWHIVSARKLLHYDNVRAVDGYSKSL